MDAQHPSKVLQAQGRSDVVHNATYPQRHRDSGTRSYIDTGISPSRNLRYEVMELALGSFRAGSFQTRDSQPRSRPPPNNDGIGRYGEGFRGQRVIPTRGCVFASPSEQSLSWSKNLAPIHRRNLQNLSSPYMARSISYTTAGFSRLTKSPKHKNGFM